MAGMRARQSLPAGYETAGGLTLDHNRRLQVLLNLASLPWAALCIGGLGLVATWIRPQGLAFSASGSVGGSLAGLLGALVAGLVITFPLHEAVHGLAYWAYTRSRPQFGFKGWYAYAAAPGWFLPRRSFLVVGLAPLVGITAVGLAALPFLPALPALGTLVLLAFNAIGAIGDVYLCLRLAFVRGTVVVEDRSDGVTWHRPARPHPVPAP
jgi:hypothetical protein